MCAQSSSSVPDGAELHRIAARLRSDTWELTERWSESAARDAPPSRLRGGDSLVRFGEIPSFLAALAHFLDELANRSGDAAGGPQRVGDEFGVSDESLRAAAMAHARKRAAAGYNQRDMLAEFVALRRVLWEHFAESGASERPTFEGERVVNLLLDTVIVEAADQFFDELTEALVRRAERDPLTELLNRQTFHDRLGRELARARRYNRRLTVVMLDLDAFKQVNDQLGHLAGDAVLKRLAALLTTHTRDEDIVGRLGGDEFAVALVETGLPAAHDLIRRLRIHLTPARRQFGLPKEFGVGFGAASFPEQGDTVEKLLFAADSALYARKGKGRGTKMTEAGAMPEVADVRVLVVDDDPGVRLLCRTMLEEQGFHVDLASNGAEALEVAAAEPPDLFIVDVAMPVKNGWEMLGDLAEDERLADIPVVMMTGRASQENLDLAVSAGAIDFIDKPFEPQDLVGTVNRVLEMFQQREESGIR